MNFTKLKLILTLIVRLGVHMINLYCRPYVLLVFLSKIDVQ